jgi:tetratricopeptide (TPR) repeat protein
MKPIILSIAMYSLLFCYLPTLNAQSQDNQSGYATEYENMDIKTIGPTAMVSPTKNEKAMIAYNNGTSLMYQNRLDEAEILLKEAIDLDPFFIDAIDHLAIVYRKQNRFEKAEEMYLKSIELNDKNIVPFLNLAVIYRIQSRLNDAFQLYRHVVQVHPNDPEGYFGIGTIFYIVGNYENSMPFLDKAIELYIDQNSSLVYDAFYYKGMIYYRINEYDEALRCLEEAKKGNSNNEALEKIINEIRNYQ